MEKKNSSPISIPDVRDINQKQHEILLQPYTHIHQASGKKIASTLATAFNTWLDIDEEKLKIIQELSEMLDDTNLLLDDVEDGSELRKGIATVHSVYGMGNTVNAINYLVFIALQKCLSLKSDEALTVCIETFMDALRGRGMEIQWREEYICPTEEQYCEMILKKSPLVLISKLMRLFTGKGYDLSKLAQITGRFLQIRDDYLNLTSETVAEKKNDCRDLVRGKFTFPLIHAIRTQPGDRRIKQILKQHTEDEDKQRYCISLLEKYGSLEYTKEKLDQLYKEAHEEIQRLGGNLEVQKILETLHTLEE